jgi:dTDP-4-dehydrorhamnose 3,5-epimerase
VDIEPGTYSKEQPMKLLAVQSLGIPDVKVIRYGKFPDHRGFFAEHFRKSDFARNVSLDFMAQIDFMQCNESFSKPGTIRGLHFQWNPKMGKLVRTLSGRMVDMVLDIRKGSPCFGKIIGCDLPVRAGADFGEWIWVPPGFAHGNFFTQDTHIEYFCSSEYNPGCEAGISPFSGDIDWSLFDPGLKREFEELAATNPLITEKDRNGYSLRSWAENPNSDQFLYRDSQT